MTLSTIAPVAAALFMASAAFAQTRTGELKQWHAIELTFTGPAAAEGDGIGPNLNPNPFLDYRLDVSFSHAGIAEPIIVPGFFAADGSAAETSADAGTAWRVRFMPTLPGDWTWTASFRAGPDVAIALDPSTFGSGGFFDGATDTFTVVASDKTTPDMRARGLLQHLPGERYPRFAGDGTVFLKHGADSPENFLGYFEFDNTFDNGGSGNDLTGPPHNDGLHHYDIHAQNHFDVLSDPSWDGGRGSGIIGAVNYLASEGVNSIYFLTMNAYGDGREVWPWTSYPSSTSPPLDDVASFDVSKLAQWEIVFAHMTARGLMLHVLTQEQENDQVLDGGALGPQRKLYYRELIARFAHHPALVWNLGEENTNSDAERKAFSDFIRDLDPYDHPIVVHTFPGDKNSVYTPLLGHPTFDGASLQNGNVNQTYNTTRTWLNNSAQAGRPWIVSLDEIGPASTGVTPDGTGNNHGTVRREGVWGSLMAGGWGSEWYFGYQQPHNDLDCEDFTSRDRWWDYGRHAIEFMHAHVPIDETMPDDSIVSGDAWALATPGDIYAVYTPDASQQLTLDIPVAAIFEVLWFDPRDGGPLQVGSVTTVSGPGVVNLGTPPSAVSEDWAALVRRVGDLPTFMLVVEQGSGDGSYPAGVAVPIIADPPPPGLAFDQWIGFAVADAFSPSTTLTMPEAAVTVTATYAEGPPLPTVASFTLIDADTDADITSIMDRTVIALDAFDPIPAFNVRANVGGPAPGSVVFTMNGTSVQTENVAPYALGGDAAGDYAALTPPLGVGDFILTATPYKGGSGSGDAGNSLTVDFRVAPNFCPGDIDGNGETTLADFSALAATFGTTIGARRPDGDLTGDGAVDLADFTVLAGDLGCAPIE